MASKGSSPSAPPVVIDRRKVNRAVMLFIEEHENDFSSEEVLLYSQQLLALWGLPSNVVRGTSPATPSYVSKVATTSNTGEVNSVPAVLSVNKGAEVKGKQASKPPKVSKMEEKESDSSAGTLGDRSKTKSLRKRAEEVVLLLKSTLPRDILKSSLLEYSKHLPQKEKIRGSLGQATKKHRDALKGIKTLDLSDLYSVVGAYNALISLVSRVEGLINKTNDAPSNETIVLLESLPNEKLEGLSKVIESAVTNGTIVINKSNGLLSKPKADALSQLSVPDEGTPNDDQDTS